MSRWIGVVASLIIAAGTFSAHAGSSLSPPSANPAGGASCTATVQVISLAFDPSTVSPGQSSAATLTLQNCTPQSQQVTTQWYGRFVGTDTGIPPGCPAMDPLVRPVALMPNGQASSSLTYIAFPSCTATALQLTVQIFGSGGTVLATANATLALSAATPTCAISYARQSEWRGGFVATVTVANTGTAVLDGWSLTFRYPGDQVVANSWNATVTQTGPSVTAVAMAYNRRIAPGASTQFGLQGSWHDSDATPTIFSLNGAPCLTR